jgi:hypothetical protein
MIIIDLYVVKMTDTGVTDFFTRKDDAFESVPDLAAQSPYNEAYWRMVDSDHKHKADIELVKVPLECTVNWQVVES